MELTQERLQHLLEDLSSFIQTSLFLLGVLLIIAPVMLTYSRHDWSLASTQRTTTPLQMKCHHLYKRFCHYSHMWILVALEELGLFGLLDTLIYWLPISNDNDDAVATITVDSTQQIGGSQQQRQSGLNHQLANVCIRGPESTQDDPLLVSGLVNTGNTCYLNSVLQALSSLPRLQVYLDTINHQYTNQHLPVTRSLYKTLRLLSRPLVDDTTKSLAFRPVDIVSAVNANHRVINREQQDAHELFQLLSGALETEGLAATKGSYADKGLKHLLLPFTSPRSRHHSVTAIATTPTTSDLDNPLTGLLANRLSCTTCGYTEAIRHFSFNNIQLTLPQTASTTLDNCLEQLTAMEYLDDVLCRKCSMEGLVQRMETEADRLQQQIKVCSTNDQKRDMISTLVQLERQRRDLVQQLAVGGSIQDEQLEKHKKQPYYQTHCGQSTKQVMVAKPPKVLCLHISRSTFHPTGVIYKNKCQLEFPEYLDMDRFCTNGTLLTSPDQPISQQQLLAENVLGGVKYRLMSIIVHYGSHSCGHFIAYKRRVIVNDCGCDQCGSTSQEDCILRTSDTWYRISDENVDMCTIDEVLLANPYMLLYESIDSPIINTIPAPTTAARILVSTENNMPPPIPIISSPSLSTSISSSSSVSSASSASTLPTTPSPSNSTDLLAVSSPSSSSSCASQRHLQSNHLVHRNKDRQNLDWQESTPPLVIY